MHWIRDCLRLLTRFRYPVSQPVDVAKALGIPMTNFISFPEFSRRLKNPEFRPTRLAKFMTRERAEQAFGAALRQERFHHNTLCSYYFNNSWLEFSLHFDEKSRLRRLYVSHRDFPEADAIEITLTQPRAASVTPETAMRA